MFVDFSDIPPLIAALIFGPVAGILVEFFKNVLNYLATGSQTGIPVGHIANFLAGILFILPTYYLYNKVKTKKGMTLALIIGTLTMAVMMSILNYLCYFTCLYGSFEISRHAKFSNTGYSYLLTLSKV